MAVLTEYQQSLAERAAQISKADTQVQSFNPNIERTQQMLRMSPQGTNILTQQAKLNEAQRLRTLAKEQATSEVQKAKTEQQQYEQSFKDYLSTDTGKLQYVKENNIPGEAIYGSIAQGYAPEVIGYKYTTPYGIVEDYTAQNKAINRELSNQQKDILKADALANMQPKTIEASNMSKVNQLERVQNSPILTERGAVNLPEVSTQSNIPITSGTANILQPGSGEKLRASIREYTGISLPSSQQVFNRLFRGAEPGSIADIQKVGPLDIIATPILGLGQVSNIVGEGATAGAKAVGIPTLSYNLPEKTIPQKVTTGGEFKLPELKVNYLSPEQIGSAVSFGTGLALGSQIPLGLLSTSTIAQGLSTTFNKELSPEQRLFQGPLTIAGGALLGKLAAGEIVYNKLPPGMYREEINTPTGMKFIKEYLSKDSIATSQDEILPIVKNGETINYAKFKMKVQQPGQFAEVNTKGKSLFFAPEQIQIKNPRTDIILTPFPLKIKDGVIQEGGLVAQRRTGAQLTFVDKYEGASSPFNLEDFSKLPKTKQYALQRLAEEKTGGTPVSLENVPLFLGKNFKYDTGGLATTRLLKISPSAEEATLIPYGRRTVRADVVSRAEPIEKIPALFEKNGKFIKVSTDAPENPFKLYRTDTAIKSSIKTFPKASGKVQFIEGISKVYKPIILDEDIGIIGSKGQKTLQKTGVDQATIQKLGEIKESAVRNVPQNKINTIGRQIPSPSVAEAFQYYPKIVAGGGRTSGSFAGTGQYELTSQVSEPLSVISKPSEVSLVNNQNKEKTIQSTFTPLSLSVGQEKTSEQKQDLIPLILQPTSQRDILNLKQAPSLSLSLSNIQLSNQKSALKSEQSLITVSTNKTNNTPLEPLSKISKNNIIFPSGKNRKKALVNINNKGRGIYVPEIRRRGKFKPVFNPVGNILEATKIGTSKALTNLGVSIQVRNITTGKIVKTPNVLGFGRSKVNPLILVQSKRKGIGVPGGRLSTRGEKSEILLTRRYKKSNNLFNL